MAIGQGGYSGDLDEIAASLGVGTAGEAGGDVISNSASSYSDVSVSPQDVSKLRRDQFLIADTSEGPAMVIKEMIGNLDVTSEDEARLISESLDDHVLAEFTVKMCQNRGPV